MPKPKDLKLYDKIKSKIYKENPKHSAYRSGKVVSEYKKSFAKKHGKTVSPYAGKKPTKTGLTRWFKEDWKSDTGKYKYTTKSSVYRPRIRVTKKTPKTFSELSSAQIKKAKKEKKLTGRVKKF